MKVLHVLEPAHGGVVTLARTLATMQADAGHEVHVLAPEGVAFEAGTVHRWSPERRSAASLLRSRRLLQQAVSEVRPDVVHLHSFFAGLLGRVGRLPTSARVVYQPHSWAFQAVPTAAAGTVARWERNAVRRTDVTVTNCRDERDEGRRHGVHGPVRVVGLPVDTTYFSPGADRAGSRRALGVDTPHLIVCVGRLNKQKGQDQLAREWEAHPVHGTTLALVGPGDQDPIAAEAPLTSGTSLRMIGDCDDVRPWYHAADVVVLPSRYEGQSVAMAEALACGAPVVSTDVNGAREAVAPSGETAAGAVVARGDMQGLLDACARRLRDPAQATQEARAARERAVRLFSGETVARRLHEAYVEEPTSALWAQAAG